MVMYSMHGEHGGSSCNYFVLYDLAGRSFGCQRPRPSPLPQAWPPQRPLCHLPRPFLLLAANSLGHLRDLCHGFDHGLICHILSIFWLPTASAISATSATASTTASSATSFPSFGCQRPRPSPLPLPRPPPWPHLPHPFGLWPSTAAAIVATSSAASITAFFCHLFSLMASWPLHWPLRV